MRLTSVHINEFKSIRDSGSFATGDVTCLVGKNEAGKTAILEALYRLNPIIREHSKFSVTHDYPRTEVEDYQHDVEIGKRKPATVVTATFELSNEEVAQVEEHFGAGLFINRLATLSRGYENQTYFDINVNEAVAVRHLISQAELPQDLRANASQLSTVQELGVALGSAAVAQDKTHKAALAAAQQIEEATTKAKAIEEANRLQESASAKQLRANIQNYLKETFKKYVWSNYLDKYLPKFLYFDEYYQMEGRVNIQKLKDRQTKQTLTDSDRPMLGLIDLFFY